MLLVVIRIHPQVVEGKFLLYPLLECSPLFQGQAVALGDDRHHVDKLAQLLQDDDIYGLERMAGGLNEEEAAVDAGVLQVAFTLGSEFLAQVGRVLVLDVLDDGVPAALVVDEVAVAGGVDNIETQAHSILLDDVRDGLDFGGAADGLVGLQASLAVHQVRGKDCVDEGGFAESSLACELDFWLVAEGEGSEG
jgi:hypothetical protein